MDADDRGPELRATTALLLILAAVFLGLRFWARALVAPHYDLDEWLLTAALCFTFALGGLCIGLVAHGLGRHIADVDGNDLTTLLKILLAFECTYVAAVSSIKLAILAMWRRIFNAQPFRTVVVVVAGLVLLWFAAMTCAYLNQCAPFAKMWHRELPGRCMALEQLLFSNSVPNIITDVVIIVMPITQVWGLQVTFAQKMSLCVMFFLGGFVLFASVYRLVAITQFDRSDATLSLASGIMWSVIEVSCGVIGACLPMLRPLVVRLLPGEGGRLFGGSKTGARTSSRRLTDGARTAQSNCTAFPHHTELASFGGVTVDAKHMPDHHFARLERGLAGCELRDVSAVKGAHARFDAPDSPSSPLSPHLPHSPLDSVHHSRAPEPTVPIHYGVATTNAHDHVVPGSGESDEGIHVMMQKDEPWQPEVADNVKVWHDTSALAADGQPTTRTSISETLDGLDENEVEGISHVGKGLTHAPYHRP